jgi:hypothetical protein
MTLGLCGQPPLLSALRLIVADSRQDADQYERRAPD